MKTLSLLLALLVATVFPVATAAAGDAVAANTALHLPVDWKIQPVPGHPFLLFGPEEAPAIRARLLKEFGTLDRIGDKPVTTYFAGDEAAKRKATADFIAFWKDYSQRWRKDNLEDRPEWIDGVAMRGIRRCLLQYDLVASYGYLTPEQTREFRDALVRAIGFAIGRDSAHPRITPSGQFRMMNIWTDIVCAAALTGLTFPELPQAHDWVEFAVREIELQFANGIWDGCWHESPRYQAAMLEITGMFFHVLQRRTGVDLFGDPRYKAMLDWLVRFQTPLDRAAGPALGRPQGVALLPGIGDSSWVAHSFGVPALFAAHYVQSDPRLASRLMWTWDRAGRPWSGDSVEWAHVLIDPAIPAHPEQLGSDISAGKGYILMRSGFATPDEVWFLLRCGNATRSTSHDNADWNAFNLYAYGAPLALDSGSGAYSDPRHKAWHDKAIAHNTVVFSARSQERLDGHILTWVTQPQFDYSASDASAAAGVEKFVRHVLFVKPDYFVIWDEIRSTEPATWMLHTPATKFTWSEHSVQALTPWDAGLDVQVVWPQTPLKPGTEKGKYSDWTETQKQRDPHPFQYQDYFGIPNAPGKDFLVVLHPTRPGGHEVTIRHAAPSGLPSLEIVDGDRTDHLRWTTDALDLQLGNAAPLHVKR